MKTFSITRIRRVATITGICKWLLLIIALSPLAATNALGQTTSNTDGSTPLSLTPGAPAGSYALSGFDNINLFNGNLNFQLPLLNVGGRGDARMQMTLTLEQRWRVESTYVAQTGDIMYSPNYNWWSGLKPGYGPGVLQGRITYLLTPRCDPTTNGEGGRILTRLTFTTPEGTEYELRDQATGGKPLDIAPCVQWGESRGQTFISSDGTAMTFISDAIIRDNAQAQGEYNSVFYPSGYLMLKSGMRYRIENGLVRWMRDRNGNKLSFTYDNHTQPYGPANRVISITDSLNRKITIGYDVQDPQPYGLCDKIEYHGFGGAARTIRISKTTLGNASDFTLKTDYQLFPEFNGSCSTCTFNPTVTSAVWLPDGRSYTFSYNSYSELARVKLPTGGAFEYDYAAGLSNGPVSGAWLAGLAASSSHADSLYRRVLKKRTFTDDNVLSSKASFSRPESQTACGNGLCTQTAGFVDLDDFDVSGNLLARSRHYFYGFASEPSGLTESNGYSKWQSSREYQTEAIATDGITVLRRTTQTWQQRAPVVWWAAACNACLSHPELEPANDPRIIESRTELTDTSPALVSKQVFGYDNSVPYNNQSDVYEYDFGPGAVGSLLRHTHTDYLTTNEVNGTAYDTVNPNSSSPDVNATIHLRGLPTKQSVYDGNGVERARTRFEYDKYSGDTNHAPLQTYPRPGFSELPISGLDAAFNSGGNNLTRGNITATTHYLLDSIGAPVSSVTAYAQFDITGNPVKAIDPRGYATTLDYKDNFGAPDGEAHLNTSPVELNSQSQMSYAFTTIATNALGQSTYAQFDYYLGQTVDAEDANGIVSSAYYNDALDRPKQLIRAANGDINIKSQTTINYDDLNHVITTTSDQYNYLDNLLKGETVYDGLGRTTEKRQYESPSTYVTVRQGYDALGRASQTSNPFRFGETIQWTNTVYDDQSRVISVTTPDNAVVKTSYSGDRVLVADQNQTDQLRRKRISKTDALGRLKDMWEITAADGATEAVSFPGWPSVTAGYHTSYEYDVLNDLTIVHHGTQTRSFAYDTLKRLIAVTNPESGPIGYQYDENGNLKVKTDARGVSEHLSYDALNRPIRRWYNGSSSLGEGTNNLPALPSDVATSDEVAYVYDSQGLPSGAPNYSRGYATGRLVAVTYGTGSSAGDYYSYDGVGRAVLKFQQTAGSNYQISATYNLAGAITSQTYPSGHIVNSGYDTAGRANNITGRLGDGRSRTYATGISYSPFGGIAQEQFGTQASLYHKLHYNLRGQLFDIRVSSYSLAANEWNWNRGALVSYYSSNYSWGGNSTGSGPDNNGNVTRQQHWVPANDTVSDYTYTQDDYAYDSLNRLSSTNEIHGGPNSQSGQDYVQSYDYDRWGNRTINTGSSSVINHAQFDKSDAQNTNRLYAPGDTSPSLPVNQRKMQYDSAGNLTHDSYTGDNRIRSYDAENRLSLLSFPTPPPPPPVCYPDGEGGQTCYPVDPRPGPPPIQYAYDADGHRVRRFVNDQETRQVYGFGGELLAEYAASTSPNTLQKEYGYRNGQLLLTAAPGYGSSGSTGPGSSPNTGASSADLLAQINKVELPAWVGGLLSSRRSGETISDTSTPLYGPRFPYASLNSSVLPVTPQSGTTRIAFASNREGTAQLYSMNTDGSGVLRLTNDAANDESPRWSPNGSRIVFQSDRDNVFSGMADIYVMNGDGSGQTRLTSDANDDSAPVWSPNGSKIAFQSARSGVSYQVYTMNSDGSGQVNISNNAANDKQPSWSPDGTKIAFASDRDQAGFSSIYVMNANGSSQTRLTFSGSGFRDEQPAWSPDGTKLAFTSTRDSSVVTWTETDDDGNTVTKTAVVTNKEVYLMNANGSNQVRLTNTLENDDSPNWSSDGTQIAFRSDRERDCCDPTNQVWVMNTNGSNPVDLSNNGFGDYNPNWSNIMTPPPPPNSAQFISQSVPQTMIAGQSYSVSVTIQNTGSNAWTSASNYNLGSQNAQDNTTWGMGRVGLPYSVGSGSQVTFSFTVTAPATSGTYNFQWRMVQDGVEWFGDFTPNVVVTVNAPSGGNPNPEPDPSTPIADVRWIVADQLGTPRMIFDQSGGLANVSRHDYLPFGEELTGQIGGRTSQQGYAGDSTRQKFTQKERDLETGLDYFGARYYTNAQGRFTSCDPKTLGVKQLVNPQRWNRYAYVVNNPLALYDPDGQDDQGKGGGKVIDIYLYLDQDNDHGEDAMTKTQRAELNGLIERAGKIGIQINVFEGLNDTAANARMSLSTSDVVIFGVHTGQTDEANPQIFAVPTNDGYFERKGMMSLDNRAPDGNVIPQSIQVNSALVEVMACDSALLRHVFPGAANYIGVNGGADHATSTFGLNQAIISSVRTIVNANGNLNQRTLNGIVTNAQRAIRNNPQRGNNDRDDSVILNPAAMPPPPIRINREDEEEER
jgi:RHS repeat-associated protein